jgi:hypothetical protein
VRPDSRDLDEEDRWTHLPLVFLNACRAGGFEHADDVRVSTLRQYLDTLGARLELVAVFDDRRVPIHLGHDAA